MNKVKKELLKNYRITYDQNSRMFELREAWGSQEGEETLVLYRITELGLIVTLLDLYKEENK